MKYSYSWLQSYFDAPLPKPAKLAELITFHSLEVEGVEKTRGDSIIEIAILPNRAHDCLSYEGMAREIGTLIGQKITPREVKEVPESETRALAVHVDDEKLCRRYIGRVVENVKIKPSPKWLKDRLVSAGQKPINNVVDIMNFVMLETGQPLHAFDADKLSSGGFPVDISVRKATAEESLTTLDGKTVKLDESVLVIADADDPLAIAGIKGGTKAGIGDKTKNIVIESANFAPGNVRKTSRKIGIRTDSSQRFENELTPEKAEFAMRYAVALLSQEAAGIEFKGGKTLDWYPLKKAHYKTGVSVAEVNRLLGTTFNETDIGVILRRCNFDFTTLVPDETTVALAPTLEGIPYKLGASISYDAPKMFDCSSFVGYLFAQAGVRIPRISVDIFVFADKVQKDEIRPGDIIFANSGQGVIYYESMEYLKGTKVPEGVDHCGLYLGNGRVAHASKKAGKVIIEDLEGSIGFKNIVGYGRVAVPGEKRFVLTIPDERLDLRIKEDLIEEIGRIYGYEKISGEPLALGEFKPAVNKTVYYIEKVRECLITSGFSEVSTYAFVEKGDIEMENPIASDKKFLRRDLAGNMMKSLDLNGRNAPLLGLETIKIFEVGKVFEAEREYFSLSIGVAIPANMKKKDEAIKAMIFDAETKLGEVFHTSVIGATPNPGVLHVDLDALIAKAPEPTVYSTVAGQTKDVRYKKISPYPFMLRDIAVFVPSDVEEKTLYKIIQKEAGDLLVTIKLFDVFEKTFEDGTKKTSYAYRLVFQSPEKTLLDEEINAVMENITSVLNGHVGWKVR